jgi:hypothetical protein
MAAFLAVVFALVVSSGLSFSVNPTKGITKGERSPLVQGVLSTGIVEETSATKVPTLNTSQVQIHLLSLQWTPEDDAQMFSRVVKDTWRWKDAVLGDGRDFFIPKPRTLKALQSFLQEGVNDANQIDGGVCVEECVVISNCARFEILLVTSNGVDPTPAISNLLLHQMESYRKRPIQLNLPLDWAGAIDPNAANTSGGQNAVVPTSDQVEELVQYWTHVEGVRDITDHLCRVAAGMAQRPRRPDRDIVFQPFSSRDAHILLQLRRTLQIAQDATATYLSILLRYAIQAGKAARTPAKVPELQELRNYGTGNSKYCVLPPAEVSQRVTAVSGCGCECGFIAIECRASSIVYGFNY